MIFKNNFDLVMPITERNIPIINKYYELFFQMIQCEKIVLIGKSSLKNMVENFGKIEFKNEDEIIKNLDIDKIKRIIMEINPSGVRRSGWYFQQFIKMAYSYHTDRPYLIWDSDTIPLKKIQFVDSEQRYLFNLKNEYNKPYFDTLEKLFINKMSRCVTESFITEHMFIDCEIMRELIEEIEKNNKIKGIYFYEKILNAINKQELPLSGFSEYETYGTYIYTKYPSKCGIRKLRTLRNGKVYFGSNPSISQVEWAQKSFNTISIEKFDFEWPIISLFCKSKKIMNVIRLEKIHKVLSPLIRTIYMIRMYFRNLYMKYFLP